MADDLHERLSALERVVADLVGRTERADTEPSAETFWALHGLRDRVAETTGAVLYTGAVDLPTGEHYDWQYARLLDDLLDADWPEHAPPWPPSATRSGCACSARSSAAPAGPPSWARTPSWAPPASSTTTCASWSRPVGCARWAGANTPSRVTASSRCW
ncbi:hypothetical protein GCM10023107_11720 [Actinoplanes octamycinicus]|uniref:hypothetical protein n=1 Tax=Actinoplanes octamycinicus TaxID=135948 RepID=UPI0031EC70C8